MNSLNYIITTISIFSISALLAQNTSSVFDDNRNKFQIGIKVGGNSSNLYDMKTQKFAGASIWGPVIGCYLSIPISIYWGIQPEALYSDKGNSGDGVSTSGQFSYTDRLSFLDVPVMIQYKLYPNLYILAGPKYSYLLSQSYTFNQNITSTTTQQNFHNDNIRRNFVGVVFGLDVSFTHLSLGGRLAWDLQDNNGDATSTLIRYHNIWGQVTLGFWL